MSKPMPSYEAEITAMAVKSVIAPIVGALTGLATVVMMFPW